MHKFLIKPLGALCLHGVLAGHTTASPTHGYSVYAQSYCVCAQSVRIQSVCVSVCVTLLTQVLTHAAEPYYGRLPTCGAEVDGTC